jgi:ferrous iron transport protein B
MIGFDRRAPSSAMRTVTVAVAGNPNAGKSTLINALAGSRLQVGNWPGVTVEKKEAVLERGDLRVRLVDLPGTYSLSPYSAEERIARDFLLEERPDVVLDVVDSTNLERNLYLTVQLQELGLPLVLALNIFDEAEAKGLKIDAAALESLTGAAAVPTVATRGRGLEALLDAALAAAARGPRAPSVPQAGSEADEERLAAARYKRAEALAARVLTRPEVRAPELTDRIDRVVLHRLWGLPVFFGAMWLVFKLTFDVSSPYVGWIKAAGDGPLKRWGAALLGLAGAPDWVVSLGTDGVLAGVGFVLAFVPVIFAMMFFVTLLEASGYMARAAFVMDRAMSAMGLHGKSFIPLLLGFGCNVPAVYATRTLEDPRDKALTALLIPLMSCGARLPVYVVFIGAFFPERAGTVLWSLYVMGIAWAVAMGVLFKRTLFRGEPPTFLLELPPYRLPTARDLAVHTWEKGKHFLVKAGTYILAVTVVVWFLLNLPWGVAHKKDSLLGRTGQAVAPVLAPLGFGTWEASASLLTGVIAKEIVVGTMAEIYAVAPPEQAGPPPTAAEDVRELGRSFLGASRAAAGNVFSTFGAASLAAPEDDAALRPALLGQFTPLSAYAFMAFVLLYMPCVVTAAAIRQEFGSWRLWFLACAYELPLAWGVAFVIYQGGRLLGLEG